MADIAGAERDKLARELARDVVGELAPEEADLFDELAPLESQPRGRRRGSDPLAFGVQDLVQVLTPFVVAVVAKVIDYLTTKAPELGYDLAKDILKDRVKGWLTAPKPSLPDTTAAILREGLGAVVENEALRHGLPAEQAATVALAVVRRLGLATA